MKSKWASQFPIYEQIGISILRDVPLDQVNPYWKTHYVHLKEFYSKYRMFLREQRRNGDFLNDWCEFIKRNPYK